MIRDPRKDPTTFTPTTRSTLVFTRKPSTKGPELISNTVIQQDSASYSNEKIKSTYEPTKPGNGTIKLNEGSTIMNPTNFRLMENIVEDDIFVTEVSSTMDPNLKTDVSEQSIVPKKLVSRRVQDRTPQATFRDEAVSTNPNSLNKEGTVPAILEIFANTYPQISQSFAPNNVNSVDPDDSANAATVEPLTPEEAESMLPNLNKKGRTASTQNIDPGIANKDKAQTIVPSIFVTIYPEFVQSFAPNRSITVNPDNLDDGATIQPMSEEVATNRPKLDKEGTRPSVPEDRTLAFKILHKEGTTKPFTLEEDITASKSLSEVTIAQSTVPEVKIKDSKMFSKEKVTMPPTDEDGTKGSQPLEKEGRTKSLVPEDSSVDSKLLNIEATTKSTIAENDTVNSEPLDNEGTKDTASEGSVTIHPKTTHFVSNRVISVHSDNLDNATKIQPIPPDDITIITPYINSEGTTKQIAPEGSGTIHSNKAEEEILSTIPEKYPTTYTEISQTESLNTATIFGLENLHIATTILSIPPDEAVTGLPNKNDGATPSKVFVKEGTTKSTIVEDSALNSESLDGEEMGATVPARYTSMHLEISESFAANKAISLDPHKSYNLATIQPTPEETTTILQYLTKVGKTQPSVVNGSSLKPNTPAEAETTFPKLDKGGTIKPTVHEDATDSKILEQDEMTKSNVPEKGHTIDSKVFDKEGRTKSIIAEDGALNSESLDHEETTIFPIESTTNYEGLTKAFYLEDGTMDSKLLDTGGRTKSTVDPTSRGKEATTKALDSEDDITNANMLDIQIAKAYVNQDVTIDSKALDNEGTTKPIIAEHGTMNSETLDSEETQTAASEGFTIVHPELEKLIIPNTAVTVDPDNLDNATQQAIPPENVATMLPHKEIEETTKPTVPEGHTTMLPDNVDKENMQFTVPEKYPTTYHGMSQSIPPNTASTLGAVRLGNATTIKSNTPEEAKTLFPKTDKEGTIKSVLPNYNNTDSKILDKTRLSNPIVPEEDPTADSRVLDKEGTTKPTPAEHSALNSKPMDIEKNPTVPEESTTEFKILDGEESTKAPVPEYGMMDSKPFDTEGTTKPTSEGSSTMDSDKVTTSAHLSPDSHDSKVTLVTKLSEALRNQTTTKAASYADYLNNPNLCNKRPSDALTTVQNGTTYIFRGHLFWTIDPKGQSLGYPQRISEVWGIPSPIDTVFTRCNCNGKTFFFKGEQYWRFQNGVMDRGYPRLITSGFSGLNGKIRAALSVAAHKNRPETVYFFKNGGRYQKYVYQRASKTCTLRTGAYVNSIIRRRFKRKTLVIKTIRSQKSDITLSHESVQLSVEMSIRKNWQGFPLRITSAISFPKPERAEKYEYFVLSGDKYYTVDPVKQKVTDTRRSVTKDLYGCD
ncbi:proteoglycan 4-like [Rhincodon typus]|uniref:proteoglycan 4-like n=1 Tax=Rhincodon typus TaxID=259920 RepID=UPI00202E9E42|nr:proteoglycan 4-like [Rhincodon typus]